MLRPAFWLIALAALVVFARWVDADPADPTRSRESPLRAARGMRVYSPHGWLSSTRGEGQLAHFPTYLFAKDRPPAGWCVLAESYEAMDSVDALLGALALAEVRDLHETRVGKEPRIASASLGAHFVVFPTWDIEAAARPPAPFPTFDPFDTFYIPDYTFFEPALLWAPGAAVLRDSSPPEPDAAEAQAYLDSYRREPGKNSAATLRLEGYLALHAGRHATESEGEDHLSGRILRTAGVHVLAWPVQACQPGFFLHGSPDDHAEVESVLGDTRTIRASWDLLQGSPARRHDACLAGLSDDDRLVVALAVDQLLAAREPLPGPAAARVLEACVRQRYDPAPYLHASATLAGSLSPQEALTLIERLVRVTPAPDDLGYLLATGLLHTAPEVRAAARTGVLARLPRKALRWLGHGEMAALWELDEREEFFAALHDRLRIALATNEDLPRLAELAGEALQVAENGFLTDTSPARSRLREMCGWLALHPRLEPAWEFQAHSTALVERAHDSDPEVRRQALSLLLQRLPPRLRGPGPMLSAQAEASLGSLEGDSYTEELFRPWWSQTPAPREF